MPDYKVVDGTYYHQDTPDEVVEILEQIRKSGARVRLFYGDKWTGRDFLEENDVVGYIHRSAGPIKTPILIPRSDSICGSPIMDNAVVRITRGKVNLYQQDNYQNLVSFSVSNDQVDPLWTVKNGSQTILVTSDGVYALAYVDFLLGKRNAVMAGRVKK
jgi:hypothetical protein